MNYTINRLITDADFEAVDARARAALETHGFGILTEIDVKSTMKKKLDVEMPAYRSCTSGTLASVTPRISITSAAPRSKREAGPAGSSSTSSPMKAGRYPMGRHGCSVIDLDLYTRSAANNALLDISPKILRPTVCSTRTTKITRSAGRR